MKKIYSGGKSYMKPGFKYEIFTIIALVSFLIVPTAALAQLNCQSEIYQPATNDPKDKFKKGYCFIKLGQYLQGVTRLKGVESELPALADYVIYYQAAGYENLGDYSSSSTLFNKILTQYPESGLKKKTLARLGSIYTQSGDYVNAERIFRSLSLEEKNRSTKASYLLGLGEALEKQGKYGDALITYKRIWVQYPETKSSTEAYTTANRISNTQGIAFQPSQSDYLERANILFDKSRWSSAL
ncbi:MAG: tetratricopeptide repeat protein, partial [Deltaproteobacteria bacterium]|nr:tetratricopeptide repeat protein [Deltaproteobacteria bacterium]